MDKKASENLERRKQKFSQNIKQNNDQGDHLILKYYPSNWFHWKQQIVLRCISNFGDDGRALQTAEDPKYVEEDFVMPGEDDMPAIGSLQLEKLKLEMRDHHNKRSQYKTNGVRMFAFILENCSEESRAIVSQRTSNYEQIVDAQDSILLIDALEKTHLSATGVITLADKARAKDKLRSIKQRAEQPLHDFEIVFDRFLTKCTTIGADIPEDELVNIYINALEYNIFHTKVKFLNEQEDSEGYPKTLLEAKLMMRKTYNAHINTEKSMNARRRQTEEEKNSKIVAAANNKTEERKFKPCLYCGETGHSAQWCKKLKADKGIDDSDESSDSSEVSRRKSNKKAAAMKYRSWRQKESIYK